MMLCFPSGPFVYRTLAWLFWMDACRDVQGWRTLGKKQTGANSLHLKCKLNHRLAENPRSPSVGETLLSEVAVPPLASGGRAQTECGVSEVRSVLVLQMLCLTAARTALTRSWLSLQQSGFSCLSCYGTFWFRVLRIQQNSLNTYLRGQFSPEYFSDKLPCLGTVFLIFFLPRRTEQWGHCAVCMAWFTLSALGFCYVSHIKAEEMWWKRVLVRCIGRKWNAM